MIEQLKPYVFQTLQALAGTNQLPSNVMPEQFMNINNWLHVDTQELVVTKEVKFLFEFNIIFMQIEVVTLEGRPIKINVIKDLNKKICYRKDF